MLESLGLTQTEEIIYELLVAQSPGSIARLAQQRGLPRTRVARAISALTDKGLVARLPGRSARFTAVQPGVAIGALTQAQEQALSGVRLRMQELDAMFDSASRTSHPAELVEVADNADGVWHALLRVERAATEQIRCFDAPPYVEPDPAEPNASELAVLRRGVACRTIYARDAILVPGRDVHISAAIRHGEQARTTASLPMKMLIGDDKLALIPVSVGGRISVGGGRAAAYLIHPSSLLDALCALFEALWERALPLNVAGEPGAPEPSVEPAITDADRRIITMLAAGATDESIGRAMGCSMRTIQRRVRDIMNLFGVQTRFQMGVEARGRGWA